MGDEWTGGRCAVTPGGIGGEEDGEGFPDEVRHVAEQLPSGEYYLIPNAGHNPHLEAPEILNRELIRFLGS